MNDDLGRENNPGKLQWIAFLILITFFSSAHIFDLTGQTSVSNDSRSLKVAEQPKYPFQNPDMPIEERVSNIVSLMTLDEKVAFLSQSPGKSAGDEVVQLYVKHINSQVSRPIQELKGFKRVQLKAGERQTVAIPLAAQSLAYWDISKNNWQVERDSIEIRVGASSGDIRIKQRLVVK